MQSLPQNSRTAEKHRSTTYPSSLYTCIRTPTEWNRLQENHSSLTTEKPTDRQTNKQTKNTKRKKHFFKPFSEFIVSIEDIETHPLSRTTECFRFVTLRLREQDKVVPAENPMFS